MQVADDEQRATRRDPAGNTLVERELRRCGMGVVSCDQVELRARFPITEVRFDPLHALGGRTSLRCALCSAGERFARDVDCSDLPALRRKPDCLGSFPTTGVERCTRRESGDLACEVWVRSDLLPVCMLVGLLPVGLPVVPVEWLT